MTQGERRLAAIMFTDMVGYTSLGQKNESLSLALVDEQRKLIRPILARHAGREVKTMGDAFLVEFSNALDAVRCAYDIQRAVREFNIGLPEEKRAQLRIGVHLGDVVELAGDISGDAVNIASRIEALAEEGGVCITRQVFDQVENKVELSLQSLGPKVLKNVNAEIEVFKVVMPWDLTTPMRSGALPGHRVAVLPFVSMSADTNDEYFADGLTEELIDRLSQMGELEVIARTSVMTYKKKSAKAAEIGKDLRAGSLVEGSVRKEGNTVRVTVQLIDANADRHLWSSRYDRTLERIFEVQSDIAQQVAIALKVRILPSERKAIERKDTTDPEAHDLYLRGRAYLHRTTEEDYLTGLGCFQRAIQRDPSYSLVYVAMSNAYNLMGFFETMPASVASEKAEAMARKAIELDDTSAAAHASLAEALFSKWDFAGSEIELRRALQLNPNDSYSHHVASGYCLVTSQFARGIEEAERALDLDPLSTRTISILATLQLYSGDLDSAEKGYNRILGLDPSSAFALGNLGLCHVRKGMFERGIEEIKRSDEMGSGSIIGAKSDLIYALTRAGRVDEARKVLSELVDFHAKNHRGAAIVADGYASLGENERAFEWLEKAYIEHSGSLAGFLGDFGFENLRSDPRFRALLAKMGITRMLF
ncbi:MAG: tetratricopeptide repeat protein [Thaumarchaeota archaeon]|nr:tetratricopeptide repeat protein [Nitrososphaerota archaeon]